MKIQLEGDAKEIAELFDAIRQSRKPTVTYGDLLNSLPEYDKETKTFRYENRLTGAAIESAPVVVTVQTDKGAWFWH